MLKVNRKRNTALASCPRLLTHGLQKTLEYVCTISVFTLLCSD